MAQVWLRVHTQSELFTLAQTHKDTAVYVPPAPVDLTFYIQMFPRSAAEGSFSISLLPCAEMSSITSLLG